MPEPHPQRSGGEEGGEGTGGTQKCALFTGLPHPKGIQLPILRNPKPRDIVSEIPNRSQLYYAIKYFPKIDEAYGGQK